MQSNRNSDVQFFDHSFYHSSYSFETCHVFSCTLRYTKDNRRIHLLCGKKDGFCPLQVVDVKLTNCIVASFCFVQHFFC